MLAIVAKMNEARAKAQVHRCTVLLSATLNDRIEHLAAVCTYRTGTPGGGKGLMAVPPARVFFAQTSLSNPRVVDCAAADVVKRALPAARDGAAGDGAPAGSTSGAEGTQALTAHTGEYATAKGLTQYFSVVPCKLRLVTLAAFLRWKAHVASENKIIVFTSSRDTVHFYQLLMAVKLDDGEPLLGDLPLCAVAAGQW